MVVSYYKPNSILNYKLFLIFIVFLVVFIVVHFLQSSYRLYAQEEQKYFFTEPIDVVYTWVNGSDPIFIQNLKDSLRINSTVAQDYSNQRFDDKYELKFSLRSLEKYAPWIHHVYIVTNGQIPYWLDLDYEKVTLVSHDEIFKDPHYLPTFSSPAIESHLHRIPGLSNRFIYFNDDIFLGAPIFIDDFISPSHGFLIYLAWPLPMCSVDCPWVYVGDGQCDSACYNRNCQMDGGDCSSANKMKSSWEENFAFLNSKEVNSQDDYLFDMHNYETKPNYKNQSNYNSINRIKLTTITNNFLINNLSQFSRKNNLRSHSIPKQLNNSKIALRVESTAASIRKMLHLNNTRNITKIIQQHNYNFILHNKRNRHKRNSKRSSSDSMFTSNSSVFIGKARINNPNIDAYGASLQYTNRIYNLRYGFKSRYVPAHSPIMIERSIMEDLQKGFEKEFRKTSTNRIRSEDDMQFAFSYYYYLINEKVNLSVAKIFDKFDTDDSGTWSDREIRTILTKIYDLPLSYATVEHFEDVLLNCSKLKDFQDIPTPEFERYVDSKLPTVSKELIINCPVLSTIIKEHFGLKYKYKYEIINNAQSTHVIFKMLSSNISEVVGHLDEIRRHTKKFICLNDNMDDSKVSENELVRAVLYDFYLSLFPNPSKFELPPDFRNRFLYIDELNQWKSYHFKLRICTYVCIFILCYVTYCNLVKRRILYRFVNKLFC